MDEDIYQKNTITRSFSRKINLGNYESADFFESRTVVVPNDTTILEYHQLSEDLHAIVMAEVEQAAAEYNVSDNADGDWEAFCRVLDNTSEFKAASMEDFEKLNPFQKEVVNKLKKAYKRSPEWKTRISTTSIENEQARAN